MPEYYFHRFLEFSTLRNLPRRKLEPFDTPKPIRSVKMTQGRPDRSDQSDRTDPSDRPFLLRA